MKIAALLFSVLLLSGCANALRKITPLHIVQDAFDATLPRSFVGPTYVTYANAFIDVTLDAGNVRYSKEAQEWEFDWLVYTQKDHFATWASSGKIVFGKPPVIPGS